jgi:transposase-like protein
MTMEDDIKRWTAKRKAALVMEIIQGKTSISEASRSFDISPSCIFPPKRIPLHIGIVNAI